MCFVYIPDWITYYSVDSFQYDLEAKEVNINICGYRMCVVLHGVSRAEWVNIRRDMIHGYYFELSNRYDWSIHLL